MKFTRKEKEFIEFVKSECKELGVKCELKNTKYVKVDGIPCSGFFEDGKDEVRLVCAMNKKNAFEILVHEYCHMTQWNEGIKIWKTSSTALSKISEWLEGKPVRNIKNAIQKAIDLELDNEKRAVKIIKAWDLNIDTKSYIKKANAYLQFYQYMLVSRKWSKPNNSPYTNKNIVELMPANFRLDYTKLSAKRLKAYKTENI